MFAVFDGYRFFLIVFDLSLTKKISSSVTVPIIASGGVGDLNDFVDGFKVGGASGLLAASVFHFITDIFYCYKTKQ